MVVSIDLPIIHPFNVGIVLFCFVFFAKEGMEEIMQPQVDDTHLKPPIFYSYGLDVML